MLLHGDGKENLIKKITRQPKKIKLVLYGDSCGPYNIFFLFGGELANGVNNNQKMECIYSL